MWKYTFIAQEHVKDVVCESERHRGAQVARSASRSVSGGRLNRVLNRVTSSTDGLTARVTNTIQSWYPSRRHTSESAAEAP
jgi:hypothetical protein